MKIQDNSIYVDVLWAKPCTVSGHLMDYAGTVSHTATMLGIMWMTATQVTVKYLYKGISPQTGDLCTIYTCVHRDRTDWKASMVLLFLAVVELAL